MMRLSAGLFTAFLLSGAAFASPPPPLGEHSWCDPLARSIAAAEVTSYKGVKIAQMVVNGKPTKVRARVYHCRPNRTRTEYIFPPSVTGTVVLRIGTNQWRFSPAQRRWIAESSDTAMESLSLVRRNYRAREKGESIVAGRPATIIALTPKTPGNPSKTLWLDKRYDLVLQSEWRNPAGQVTSWSKFVEIEYNPRNMPDELFEPPDSAAKRCEQRLNRPPFRVVIPGYVPEGYVLAGVSVLPLGHSRAVHVKYTNGLNTISLFERLDERASERRPANVPDFRAGVYSRAISWRHDGLSFTLIGDLDTDELRKIAQSTIAER